MLGMGQGPWMGMKSLIPGQVYPDVNEPNGIHSDSMLL